MYAKNIWDEKIKTNLDVECEHKYLAKIVLGSGTL